MAQTPEQYQKLIDTLETLEVVPKADNILEFEAWMKSYLESKGEKVIKTEPEEKGPTETEKSRNFVKFWEQKNPGQLHITQWEME